MKNAWRIWLKISKTLMGFGANIILIVLYIILIIPLGFVMRLFFEKNLLGHGYSANNKSFWVKLPSVDRDMTWAREQ